MRQLVRSEPISTIVAALGADAEVYLVGGTVRDTLLRKPTSDFDLACSLPAVESARRLADKSIRTVDTGLRHGTILVLCGQNNVEITSFRSAASAICSKASIMSDINARDFTINAMAFPASSGDLLDPLNGLADLEAGLLRAVPPAEERFLEDPLRILRLVRFGPAEGRSVEEATDRAARQHAAGLDKVAPERIRNELEKILISSNPAQAFRYMLSAGILPFVVPEMVQAAGFEQNRYHIHDVFEHTLSVIERCPPELRLRLVALFHDLGKPQSLSVAEDGERHFYQHETISRDICRKRLQALRFSNSETDSICRVVDLHMRPLDCGPAGLRRLMRDLGPDFDLWRVFKLADASPTIPEEETLGMLKSFDAMVVAEKARVEKLQAGNALAVKGEDLIGIGIKPGPRMGAILKALQELVLDDPALNERRILLERARQMLSGRE